MNSAGRTITVDDQAKRLRELARRHNPTATTIAVMSGKGGVGKTNLAVNLAICLRGLGPRVTLVDLDLGLANADLLLNVQPRHNLAHVLSGIRSLDDVITTTVGGLRFVPGAAGVHSVANLGELERRALMAQLQNLARSTDILVLDCAAGVSFNVIGFADLADHVLVVTTPEPTAVADAYATLKALQREAVAARLALFVNMAESRAEAQAVFERIAGVAQRFLNYPIASGGYMLHDTAVAQAVRARCPFVVRYPGSNASACIAAAAGGFTRNANLATGRGGLFRRVAGLFV